MEKATFRKRDKKKVRTKVEFTADSDEDAQNLPKKKKRKVTMKANYAAIDDVNNAPAAEATTTEDVYSAAYLQKLAAQNEQAKADVPEVVEEETFADDNVAVAPEMLESVTAEETGPGDTSADRRYAEYARKASEAAERKQQTRSEGRAMTAKAPVRKEAFADDSSSEGGNDVVSFAEQQLQRASAAQGVVDTSDLPGIRTSAATPSALPPLSMHKQVHALRAQALRMQERAAVSEQRDAQLHQLLQMAKSGVSEAELKAKTQQNLYTTLQVRQEYFEALGSCYEALTTPIKDLLQDRCNLSKAMYAGHRERRVQWSYDEDAESGSVREGKVMVCTEAHAERIVQRDAGWMDTEATTTTTESVSRDSILEGVDAQYATLGCVTQQLLQWRAEDLPGYRTIVEPSLALCVEPFVNLDLAEWDVFGEKSSLSTMPWHDGVVPLIDSDGMTRGLRTFIAGEIVLPHIVNVVLAAYDPLSITQTRRLAAVLEEISCLVEPRQMQPIAAAVETVVLAASKALKPCILGTFSPSELSTGEVKGVLSDGTSVFRASDRRYTLCLRLLEDICLFQGALPDAALKEVYMAVFGGVVVPHLLSRPRTSFALLGTVASDIHAELSKVPDTWYTLPLSVGQPKEEERVQKLQQIMGVMAQAFVGLRQTLGRETHQEMLQAATAFRTTCDLIGDRSTLRMILG